MFIPQKNHIVAGLGLKRLGPHQQVTVETAS